MAGRSIEDQVQAEVRRRWADYWSGAGLDEGRLGQEVLFLLPVEFVRMYQELFELALQANPSGADSGSRRDEGQIKASGRTGARDQHASAGMHTRELHAAVTKPAFKQKWVLRSEVAGTEKRKLDRKIVRAVASALRVVKDEAARERAIRAGLDAGAKATPEIGDKGDMRRICPTCSETLMTGWVRCPFEHSGMTVQTRSADR